LESGVVGKERSTVAEIQTASRFAVTTEKSVAEAVEAVQAAVVPYQFGVLWHLDINQTLQAKGQEPVAPFHVLEVCSAPRARRALTLQQSTGYFLPCKIVVYQEDATGQTVIGLQRPQVLVDLTDNPPAALQELAQEVEASLMAAIRKAAQ
jgi:uncharacterized protein (DUF302 family)